MATKSAPANAPAPDTPKRADDSPLTGSGATGAFAVSDLEVCFERKAIKNLHIGVYPPDGRVRVAAPLALSEEAIRLAVVTRLGWIKRRRAEFAAQPRQGERQVHGGESHYVFGQRLRLRVVEGRGAPTFKKRGAWLEAHLRPGLSEEAARRALSAWGRALLREQLAILIEKWSRILGVEVASWSIKQMKTKWGSCNVRARQIWFNLELWKKPLPCIEYLVVHELIHLLERLHSPRFVALLDRHLPSWRALRDQLNAAPLGHDVWNNAPKG